MSANDHLHPHQFEYHTGHQPPDPDYGAPMHDVESILPGYHEHPHVYGRKINPAQYPDALTREFTVKQNQAHDESRAAITRARGNPDADVKIYRAGPTKEINPGDWVTPSKTYAHLHRESNGEPDWHVASRVVKAKHLFTEGEHTEWGWNPHGSE